MGVSDDVVEGDCLGSVGFEVVAEGSDEPGSGAPSPVAFPDVDEVDGGDALRGVVGPGGGAPGEACGFPVLLGDEDCAVRVVEHGVHLVCLASFSFGGGVPDAGVVNLVVGLEGEAHLGEGGFVVLCGFAYGGHGLWWVCNLYNGFVGYVLCGARSSSGQG